MRFLGKTLANQLPPGVQRMPPAPPGKRFYEGQRHEGMPTSVLPSDVQKKLDNGEPVSLAELTPL
jgi:hypothetical protein